MKKQKRLNEGSRRTFLRGIAATPLLPVAVATASLPAMADAQTPAAPNEPQVEALAALVQARFGAYLAPGDMQDIKRGIQRNLRYANALAQVKLTNADEPDFTFFADGPQPD